MSRLPGKRSVTKTKIQGHELTRNILSSKVAIYDKCIKPGVPALEPPLEPSIPDTIIEHLWNGSHGRSPVLRLYLHLWFIHRIYESYIAALHSHAHQSNPRKPVIRLGTPAEIN